MAGIGVARAEAKQDFSALEKLYPSLDALYLELHRAPELSGREEKTGAKMAAAAAGRWLHRDRAHRRSRRPRGAEEPEWANGHGPHQTRCAADKRGDEPSVRERRHCKE